MSSNRKKSNKKNNGKRNNENSANINSKNLNKNTDKNLNENIDKRNIDKSLDRDTDKDFEECDRLLEQLDKMEKEQVKEDISSKVKSLIRSDKEAIRKMQAEMSRLDEDDDLDYLDDEKIENEEDEKAGYKNVKDEFDNKTDTETESEKSDDIDEDDVKLDFFANLDREDDKDNLRIRKKQPKRLHNGNDTSKNNGFKGIIANNRKNFIVGTMAAMLLIVLVVALALDAGNAEKDSKKSIITEFLKIDTTPMIDTMNNYYAALAGDDINQVKSFLIEGNNVSDEEIERKSEEAKVYADLISSSFLITDCYVQQGLKDNEYVAYMKFQLQLKSIETPAVGIFTCYFVNDSKDIKTDYKISTDINDKTSAVYKHIAKMKNCSNVKDLFEKVDKELEEACNKDENLKAVVEALEETGQSSEEMVTIDESTTEPMKNDD